MSGYRIRITESAGTPLSCERVDCVTCHQGDDKRINCRQRNILYESECTLCAVGKEKDGKGSLGDGRGIYVGESSRSIYERAREHEMYRVKCSEESHQVKHWLSSHEEERPFDPPTIRGCEN